ncbi:MAG: hypothetical protein KIT17_12160 [Rubrivivax sp.]|nr:hypothetical protein [Rubrivivax sp.]
MPALQGPVLWRWIGIAAAVLSAWGCGGSAAPAADEWVIPSTSGTRYRAVHMGGNWGTNVEASKTLPPGYFEYLRDLNVNWVGISVALHVDDSLDPTVERKTSGVRIPTFADDVLTRMIRAFRTRGFQVYLTLAFELEEARTAARPLQRWQLGDPFAPDEDPSIVRSAWPWATDHPDHARFVADFWRTYTEQAVHFARLAQAEGVALYSLGTETDRLFRSRPGGRWPNAFGSELKAMVQAVRAVYGGRLTYDMHYDAVKTRTYFGPGSDPLWADLGLDVIGLSAYFELAEAPPSAVTGIAALESAWERIFDDHLLPLKARNPGKPIVFTEFGYVDSTRAPFEPNAEAFTPRIFVDRDGNTLDDGEETQAHIIRALFNVMSRRADVVEGAFLWETMMADGPTWAAGFAGMRTMSVRAKLAEVDVRAEYGQWAK